MKIQRTLKLSISLDEDEIEVTVSEPESGKSKHFRNFAFCPDEHPGFNEIIGEEIYSWISLWMDEGDRVELCTFPEEDGYNYHSFSVPKAWLLRRPLFLHSGELIQGDEEGLNKFLKEYTWDEAHSLYLLAKSEGVVSSEKEVYEF